MTAPWLADLQELDSALDRARERIAELESLLADRTRLDEAEASARDAGETSDESRRQLRERELELKSLEARIAELEQKLYSGRIRNPKELEGFEREARMYKQNQGKLEETVLALMETAEQSERAAHASTTGLESMRREREQSEGQWRSESDELRGQVADLEHARRELRAQGSADDLHVYDRLRRRTPQAVVLLREQRCGACNIEVSRELAERVRDETALAQCDNCSRILAPE